MVDKYQVISALEEIGRYLDIQDKNRFKALAYQRAARSIAGLSGDLARLLESGELLTAPGIGKGIRPILEELATTGSSAYLEQLRSEYPSGIFELLRVPHLGLRKIGLLYEKLGIKDLNDLQRACNEEQLRTLPGFGEKTETKICEGLVQLRSQSQRILLPHALEAAGRLAERLARLPHVLTVEVAGSVRRRLETVGDIDICLTSANAPATVVELLALELLGEAESTSQVVTGKLAGGMRVKIFVTNEEQFGLTLLHTTGSSEFVDAVKKAAAAKGIDLGLEGGVAATTEDEIFSRAGLVPTPPELREAGVTHTKSRRPPQLITHDHLRGTFHLHTTYSDGRSTLYEMLDASVDRGLTYAGISDHSKTAAYAGGLTESRLAEQHEEIEKLRPAFAPLHVFKGSEVDILGDGQLDFGRETLGRLDFVIASVHSNFKMPIDEMTERIVKAMANPFMTFLGHLTGRLLLSRDGYSVDFDKVFEAAAKAGVMIEINGNPHRLDLDWRLMKKALDHGVIFSIHPDAHSTDAIEHTVSGTWAARKGGLEPKHVFNTLELDAVREFLSARRQRATRLSIG